MQIIILGPPGAGKGTQANLLCDYFKIPKISTGDMLRSAIAERSSLGQEVEAVISRGDLVSDEIMVALVKSRISQPDCGKGFLLDGFPRTLAQARALRDAGIEIMAVVELKVSDEVIVRRMQGRRVHLSSGRVYHLDTNPPKVSGVDDLTGEELVQREDDAPDTVLKRLKLYHDLINPLVDFYQHWRDVESVERSPDYVSILGDADVNEVQERIVSSLGKIRRERE